MLQTTIIARWKIPLAVDPRDTISIGRLAENSAEKVVKYLKTLGSSPGKVIANSPVRLQGTKVAFDQVWNIFHSNSELSLYFENGTLEHSKCKRKIEERYLFLGLNSCRNYKEVKMTIVSDTAATQRGTRDEVGLLKHTVGELRKELDQILLQAREELVQVREELAQVCEELVEACSPAYQPYIDACGA